MIKTQYFWKLWDAANVITGFAATQALAFAFIFITSSNLRHKLDSWISIVGISFFLIIGCAIYSVAVSKSIKWAKSLLLTGEKMEMNKEDLDSILTSFTYSSKGRIATIIFFTILDICVLIIASPCIKI